MPGPSTRIDLTGVHFSMAAPARCRSPSSRTSWSSCAAGPTSRAPARSRRSTQRDGEQVARNVQPLAGRAGQVRLPAGAGRAGVRPTTAPSRPTCRIDMGRVTTVPFTLLPPAAPRQRLSRAVRRRPLRAPAADPRDRRGRRPGARADRPDAPDLAVLFVTAPLAGALEDIAATVRATLRPTGAHRLHRGCGRSPAARRSSRARDRALRHAHLARTRFRGAEPRSRRSRSGSPRRRRHPGDGAGGLAQPDATLVLLADPFSFPVEAFARRHSPPSARAHGRRRHGQRPHRAPAATGWCSTDRSITSDGAVGVLLAARPAGPTRGVAGLPSRSANRSSSPRPPSGT